MQTQPARIAHNMLREVKVKIARWHQGGQPQSVHECVNELEDLGGDRQINNDKSPICSGFPEGSCQQCPSTLSSSETSGQQ